MEAGAYFIEPQFSWKDRLKFSLFPEPAISNPEMEHKDIFVCRTTTRFSWLDRLRIVLTGKVMVETRTATENEIGAHQTKSIAYPIL